MSIVLFAPGGNQSLITIRSELLSIDLATTPVLAMCYDVEGAEVLFFGAREAHA